MRSHRSGPAAAALALLLSSCGNSAPEEVSTVEAIPSAPPAPQPERADEEAAAAEAERPLYSDQRQLMGTVFIIRADAPESVAEPAVDAAFAEIARLEQVLSEWRDTTEISRLNQSAGSGPQRLGDDAFAVVNAGVDVSRWSDGAFDLSWAALHGLYDFRPGHIRIPPRSDIEARLPRIDWEQIRVDAEAQTVALGMPEMVIGTGGIGKGYALDRAGEILRAAGIESYMLFGGGQVQVHGQRSGRPWRVGIQHPRRPSDYFAFFESDGGSISTSGDYEHVHIDEHGQRWHHIIDTDTGLPARNTVSVTLISEEGLYADALSTAVFILGPEKGIEMLNALPFRADAIIVDKDCRIHTTEGGAAGLVYRTPLEDGVLPGCDS